MGTATIIDALVVELGLDIKKLISGQNEALDRLKNLQDQAEKRAKAIEDSNKRALESLKKVAEAAFGLFAAFTAGKSVKDFVSTMTQMDANMGRLARTLDTNVGVLSQWRGAATLVGGTAEGVTGSISNLVSGFEQFSITGQSSTIPYFRAMQVALVDTQGHMRSFNDVFLDMAAWGEKVKDKARVVEFFRGAGITDPGTINLLLMGRQALQQYLDMQKKYAPTDADVAAAQKLQLAYAQLSLASSALGRKLLTEATPALLTFIKHLNNLADWLGRHPTILTAIALGLGAIGTAITVGFTASAIGIAISGLEGLLGVLSAIAGPTMLLNLAVLTETTLPALSEGFLAVGAAMEATPFGWVVTALALLTIAGYEFITHWTQIKDDFLHLWHEMNDPKSGTTGLNNAGREATAAAGPLANLVGSNLGNLMTLYYHWFAKPGSDKVGPPGDRGRALLNAIAGTESTSYDELYGGGKFSSYADHPNIPVLITRGPNKGKYSTAAGRYQFTHDTWLEASKGAGVHDFSPASQDAAALWLAQKRYNAMTGSDLMTDLQSNDPKVLDRIGFVLSRTWTSLPGGIEQGQTSSQFIQSLGAGAAAKAANDNRSYSSHQKETNIGTLNINTNNDDPYAHAKAFLGAVDGDMGHQANYGPVG